MDTKLILANICRWIARIGSIVISIFCLYIWIIMIQGVQLDSALAALFCVYSLYLFGMLAGLAIAWRNESLGAAITLVITALSFIVTLRADPHSIFFIFPILLLSIGLLFLISWLLHRKPLKMESQADDAKHEQVE